MFGFIKRLAGREAPLSISADPFGREEAPPPSVAPVRAASLREPPAIVLQRDEIIDAKTRIAGYRFAVCVPESSRQSDHQANARATHEVLRANNVGRFAERRLALIPLQVQDWSAFDYQPLIGRHTAFLLDLPASAELAGPWREVAAAIRLAGARVAMRSLDVMKDRALIRDCVDLLLIDFSAYALRPFERLVKTLKREQPKLELIVENIRTWPEHRLCVSRGLAYCMGSFSTCPDEISPSGEISQGRLALIEMLNLVRRDADLEDIAAVAKRDPGVAVKLVAMANSPMLALLQPVTSIDQAIMVLGREQLYRWVSFALFRAGTDSPRDELLLEIALTRGRFLELVGRSRHSKLECDELFLLGLLSLLDSLLGISMDRVVERLNLSDAIRAVLLQSDGPLGRYLMLAIAAEKGQVDHVGRLAALLLIPLVDIEVASVEALVWAGDAVRSGA
jgi:EAL and modified HD-GYP domain-containing signal transduction protein